MLREDRHSRIAWCCHTFTGFWWYRVKILRRKISERVEKEGKKEKEREWKIKWDILIVSHLKFNRSPFKEGRVHSVLNIKVVKFPSRNSHRICLIDKGHSVWPFMGTLNSPRWYAKSPTAQVRFQPKPQQQLCWGDQVMIAISCIECSQVAGLIQKVGRRSSKVLSLCSYPCIGEKYMGSCVFWFPKRAYNSVNANFKAFLKCSNYSTPCASAVSCKLVDFCYLIPCIWILSFIT